MSTGPRFCAELWHSGLSTTIHHSSPGRTCGGHGGWGGCQATCGPWPAGSHTCASTQLCALQRAGADVWGRKGRSVPRGAAYHGHRLAYVPLDHRQNLGGEFEPAGGLRRAVGPELTTMEFHGGMQPRPERPEALRLGAGEHPKAFRSLTQRMRGVLRTRGGAMAHRAVPVMKVPSAACVIPSSAATTSVCWGW